MLESDTAEALEERLQVLESKILYQDRTIDDLNGVVTRQQDQIDVLTSELRRMRLLLSEWSENAGRTIDGGEEPPPPHY